jgi:D-inositol-3-phosphate glycosyltransferase
MRRQASHLENGSIGVAMIEPTGGHSGAHYYDFGLCRGLLKSGCHVSLFTCDETLDPGIPGLDFCTSFRGVFGNRNRWLRGYSYVAGAFNSFRRAAARKEIICHFQVFNALLPELLVITLAKCFRRKLILAVHDVDCLAGPATRRTKLTKWLYSRADHIIVHNEISRSELLKIGISSRKISVVPHGNYLDSMRPLPPTEAARKNFGIDEGDRVVLFFGQIKDVKGLDILIEAMPVVAREVPSVVFLIAGRPWRTDFSFYENLIDRVGERKRCRFHIRYIPDDEVANYYAAADLVVMPYRRIYQSGVLMMAMTYGRPVVVSDLPGMTDIVKDGVNGYVFTQGSTDQLAQTLISALHDEAGRKEVAHRASEYIRKHHDWNLIAGRTLKLYESVLAQ